MTDLLTVTLRVVLASVSLASSGPPPPQLLVIGKAAVTACRAAPPDWDSTVATESATATAVAEDLWRYFAGLSAQFTRILEAAWHGRVRFCTDADETIVATRLATLVIKPPKENTRTPDLLPIGAAELLQPLASRRLLLALRELRPATEVQRERQRAALAIVEAALAHRQPHSSH
jgi:hypothetical protein